MVANREVTNRTFHKVKLKRETVRLDRLLTNERQSTRIDLPKFANFLLFGKMEKSRKVEHCFDGEVQQRHDDADAREADRKRKWN
jgi:hypothetical protein